MQQSFAYILNRRPFRESSILVDIFTEDYGRICCVARPAKKRGKIIKGNLEPFRYLNAQWIGKGDVQTLTEVDERGRHSIPPSEMMLGLYINELLLRLCRQHVPMPDLFSAYKYTLHKLGDISVNQQIMMQFEVYLLASLGHTFAPQSDGAFQPKMRYRFSVEEGLVHDVKIDQSTENTIKGIPVSGSLLLALQDMKNMSLHEWKQLRNFLDAIFSMLSPQPINARKLLNI